MRRAWILPAVTAALMATGGVALGSEPQRYEDAVGDATGDSPDIVAVTVSEPDEGPLIRFAIELTPERPFGTDLETWTDTVFIIMSSEPTTDDRGILTGDHYTTGTHGVTLAMQEQTGAFLVTEADMYYYVVDVDATGPVLTFTFDHKLIDSPLDLYWQVLLGVERDDSAEGEMEGDIYPEEGEPPAHYHLGVSDW